MMICPKCGVEYTGLACEACLEWRSFQALVNLQATHLDSVRRREYAFHGARTCSMRPWHLMLFGDPARAYCGAHIQKPRANNRRDIPYADLKELGRALCPACLQQLRKIEREKLALKEQP